jgi:signal transduction histidine kinase
VLLQVAASAIVVLLLVILAGTFASRRLAEKEAVNDAARTTDLLAESVIQPVLEDAVVTGQPEAYARLDAAIRTHALSSSISRIKLWTEDGRIVYSDERRLVGKVYRLDADDREVFHEPRTVAEVTDLSRPENQFERGQGKLLEVYRPVWTPGGTTLLFETYAPYDIVRQRSEQIWHGMAGVTLSSLLLLIVLLIPVVLALTRRVVRSQRHREELLRQVVDASGRERRRIAGTLHDGAVQDLAATSYSLTAAGHRAAAAGDTASAETLQEAAGAVRTNIQQLRTLLVDIYPASLTSSGLSAALTDLAATVRGRGFEVQVSTTPEVEDGLDAETEHLIFQVAQECLRNAAKHSRATTVELSLSDAGDGEIGGTESSNAVQLDIVDNGCGFDPGQVLANPAERHFGLRLLADTVAQHAAVLEVATAPGAGTHWRLRLPKTATSRARRPLRRARNA